MTGSSPPSVSLAWGASSTTASTKTTLARPHPTNWPPDRRRRSPPLRPIVRSCLPWAWLVVSPCSSPRRDRGGPGGGRRREPLHDVPGAGRTSPFQPYMSLVGRGPHPRAAPGGGCAGHGRGRSWTRVGGPGWGRGAAGRLDGGCGPRLECADVTVPLDWDEPRGPTITMPVLRYLAGHPGRRIGSLFVLPSGPGDSGVEMAPSQAGAGHGHRGRFDVVGWDTRGTGGTGRVDCFGDPAARGLLGREARPDHGRRAAALPRRPWPISAAAAVSATVTC